MIYAGGAFGHRMPNSPIEAYFMGNPDDEGFMASQVADVLGYSGSILSRIPYAPIQAVGAVSAGVSAGLKFGVLVKGDELLIENPYYLANAGFFASRKGVDFYP